MTQTRTTVPASDLVLELRTARPARAADELRRTELVGEVLASLDRTPVVVVSGAAGSGKTTFAAQVASAWPGEVCWASLHRGDDEATLWSLIRSAAGRETGGGRNGAMDALLSLRAPLVVLDDFTELPPVVCDEAADMIDILGGHTRFVVSCRGGQAPSFDRLRGRGLVTDVDAGRLSFDASETGLITDRSDPTSAAGVWELTEGWPALVRLAGPDTATRTEGYLRGFVLDEMPDTCRTALRWASLFANWTPELLQELVDVPAGDLQAAVVGLSPAVVTSDRGGQRSFAIHPQLREVLRRELDSFASAEQLREVREAASGWFAANGMLDEAVNLLLALERPREAARLASGQGPRIVTAQQGATVVEWYADMPAEVRFDIDVGQALAWALFETTGPRALLDWCSVVEAEAGLDEVEHAHIATLRAFAHRVGFDHDAALAATDRAVELAGSSASSVTAMALMQRLEIARWRGRYEDSIGDMDAIEACVHRGVVTMTRIKFPAVAALAAAEAGYLAEATERIESARLALELARGVDGRVVPDLELAEALVEIERGDRDRAEARLAALVDRTADYGYPTTMASIRLRYARLIGDRDPDAALAMLDLVQRSAPRNEPILDARLAAETAVVLHSKGDTAGAAQAVAHVERIGGQHVGSRLRVAGLLVELDQCERAIALLPDDLRVKNAGPRFTVAAELLKHRLGLDADVVAAVRTADECGLTGPVVMFFPDGLLEGGDLTREVRPQFLQRVGAIAPSARSVTLERLNLTSRESEILGLLLTRLTLKEISREVHLSPNTVKSHTRSLYRKLGVASRRQAAEFAEANGLSPHWNTPEG